jgi:hypothetical protein
MPECHVCEKKGVFKDPLSGQTQLFQCSRCKVALYCSVECQKKSWKGHKMTCKRMGKERLREIARGEASLSERQTTTEKSPVKHFVLAEGGKKFDLLEGENWFNMFYGFFHEPTDIDSKSTTADTRVCLNVDGPYCAIKNYSHENRVCLARDGSASFKPIPRLQMRILRPNDSIHLRYEGPDGLHCDVPKEITWEYFRQTSSDEEEEANDDKGKKVSPTRSHKLEVKEEVVDADKDTNVFEEAKEQVLAQGESKGDKSRGWETQKQRPGEFKEKRVRR